MLYCTRVAGNACQDGLTFVLAISHGSLAGDTHLEMQTQRGIKGGPVCGMPTWRVTLHSNSGYPYIPHNVT